MKARTPNQIEAEIAALRARIRRLRLERKTAELAKAEDRLMQIANSPECDGQEGGPDAE